MEKTILMVPRPFEQVLKTLQTPLQVRTPKLLRYYELDAHISDLGRSVYEPEYLFSLLAAMFISI